MIQRVMKIKLQQLAQKFPVVSIVGPRQSGKTILCKSTFPSLPYINLEKPSQRELLQQDMEGFVKGFRQGVIVDEIQKVPELLSYIQDLVDNERPSGPIILTGSNQYEIGDHISQSLAGRNAILRLLPFSISEAAHYSVNKEELLLNGFYPRIYEEKLNSEDFLDNYIDNYIQRDVRQLLNIRNLEQFEIFLRLCAGRSGQLLNLSQLGNQTGLSHPTIRQWISVLASSSIIYLLKPYHQNFSKRIIKAPKIYFTDTGILCRLLGIQNITQLKTHPLYGEIFETMIVSEIIKQFSNSGRKAPIYFYRNQMLEIDLLVETEAGLKAIEIKSSSTFNRKFFRQLDEFRKISKLDPGQCQLITGSDVNMFTASGEITAWNKIDLA